MSDLEFRPEYYGAVGNGLADDSAAMRLAARAVATAGGRLILAPRATYLCRGVELPRSIHPIIIEGQGASLRANRDLHAGESLFHCSLGTQDTTIRDVTFDGAGLGWVTKRTKGLVVLRNMWGLRVENVRVSDTQYIGLSLDACNGAIVTKSKFAACGWNRPSANGGSALQVAAYQGEGAFAPNAVSVTDCDFSHNNWSGLHLSAANSTVTGNRFCNNAEAHIFGSSTLHAPIENVTIIGNTMDMVRQVHISAVAIEMSGSNLTIASNVIQDCEQTGISLTKVNNATVVGNTINGVGATTRDTGTCIQVVANGSDATGDRSKNLAITGNTLLDSGAPPVTEDGVLVFGSGEPMQDCVVNSNVFARSLIASSGDAFRRLGTVWQRENGCVTYGNVGIEND